MKRKELKAHLKKIAKAIGIYKILSNYLVKNNSFLVREQIVVNKIWLGDKDANCYGGYFVNPDMIDKDSVVYSAGIGLDIEFEKDLITQFGCKVFCFDPTPRTIEFMTGVYLPGLQYFEFGLSKQDGKVDFYLPKNPVEFVSGSMEKFDHLSQNKIRVEMRSLGTILQDLGHKKIDLLKIDIEGAEYEIIDDIVRQGIDVRQIVLEFHHWLAPFKLENTINAIKKLNKVGYMIFGISESGLEFSFQKSESYKI